MKGGSNRLVSAADAAEILGLTRTYIYRNWRALGLDGRYVGKYLKFSERGIQNYIDRKGE